MQKAYKILRPDLTSLTEDHGHGRVQYRLGTEVKVPGRGAYVSETGAGILSAGRPPEDAIWVEVQVREPLGKGPKGVTRWRFLTVMRALDREEMEAVCREAVRQDSWALRFVPEVLRTAALCLAAVKRDGGALEFVPLPLRTEVLCLAAIEQDSWALHFVPEVLRTAALCLAAVRQNGDVFRFVPDGDVFRFGPEVLCTAALCRAAVRQDGDVFRFVPAEVRRRRSKRWEGDSHERY